MDLSFTPLNFNSVETLPGFEARAAFLCSGKALRGNPVNSASVFREDVDISLMCRGAVTIRCHSTCSRSSRKTLSTFGSFRSVAEKETFATAPTQGSKWERYPELRSQVIDLEAPLAEEWLSPELMSALRYENLRGELTEKRNEIVRQVKALIVKRLRNGTEQEIVAYLRGGSFYSRRLADIVNFIRLNPESFGEWHSSETAQLFAPPVFRNQKKSAGYFF